MVREHALQHSRASTQLSLVHLLHPGAKWIVAQINATESGGFPAVTCPECIRNQREIFALTPVLDDRFAFCLRSSAFINPAEAAHTHTQTHTQQVKKKISTEGRKQQDSLPANMYLDLNTKKQVLLSCASIFVYKDKHKL